MVGGCERPAAPGGGLRDRRRRRRGSWMRGESRRALGVAANARCRCAYCPSPRATPPRPCSAAGKPSRAAHRRHRRLAAGQDRTRRVGMEGPKGPGPDLKRIPPLPALHGPYASPSRRPQGCQGSAARAPRHQVAAHRRQLPPLSEEVLDGYSLVLCTV